MDREGKRQRKLKPRKQWKKYRRPGKGELLTVDELARALGESERTIRNWRAKGIIPTLVLGHRSLRFVLSDVLEALRKRRVK
jgi:excisionase family DNA binding protein